MKSTTDRQETLIRARRKRAYLLRYKPHWVTALKDVSVMIDALEILVMVAPLKGGNNAEQKK